MGISKTLKSAFAAECVVLRLLVLGDVAWVIANMLIIANWIGNVTVVWYWAGLIAAGVLNTGFWFHSRHAYRSRDPTRTTDLAFNFYQAYSAFLSPGFAYLAMTVALGALAGSSDTNFFTKRNVQLWQEWENPLLQKQSISFTVIIAIVFCIASMKLGRFLQAWPLCDFAVVKPAYLVASGQITLDAKPDEVEGQEVPLILAADGEQGGKADRGSARFRFSPHSSRV